MHARGLAVARNNRWRFGMAQARPIDALAVSSARIRALGWLRYLARELWLALHVSRERQARRLLSDDYRHLLQP